MEKENQPTSAADKSAATEGEVVKSSTAKASTTAADKTDSYATISLVLGVLGICGACASIVPLVSCFALPATIIMSLAGMVLGFMGKTSVKNKQHATVGIILNILVLVAIIAIFLLSFVFGVIDGFSSATYNY